MNPIQQFSIMKTAEIFAIPAPALFQFVVIKINSRVLGHVCGEDNGIAVME